MKEKLLISACLLGRNCKYNGGNNYHPLAHRLAEAYDLVPVCPECLGGLKIPHAPSVLKERSPSCGCGAVYDGTFTGTVAPGNGLAAELLLAAGVAVYGESRIQELLAEKGVL